MSTCCCFLPCPLNARGHGGLLMSKHAWVAQGAIPGALLRQHKTSSADHVIPIRAKQLPRFCTRNFRDPKSLPPFGNHCFVAALKLYNVSNRVTFGVLLFMKAEGKSKFELSGHSSSQRQMLMLSWAVSSTKRKSLFKERDTRSAFDAPDCGLCTNVQEGDGAAQVDATKKSALLRSSPLSLRRWMSLKA